MPTNAIKTTFADMSAADFRVYAEAVVDAYPAAADRQRSQAYLQQIVAQDRVAQDLEQRALTIKKQRRRRHQQIIEDLAVKHAHDFIRAEGLFVDQVKTDAEILQLLTNDDVEVFIRDRDITGEVLLSGSNVNSRASAQPETRWLERCNTRARLRDRSKSRAILWYLKGYASCARWKRRLCSQAARTTRASS